MTIYDGSARELACDLFTRGLGYRVVAGRMPMVSRISMTGQIGWRGRDLWRSGCRWLGGDRCLAREKAHPIVVGRALLSQGTVLHRHGEGSSYRRVRAMATISGAAYSRKSR